MKFINYEVESNIELCVRDENGCIVAWCVGYSEEEVENLLGKHSDWYLSSVEIY